MKGNFHMYKLCMVLYNAISPTYNLLIPFFNTGSVEEWLKFWQNLQAVITRQNITDPQGMYASIKSMLCGDALTAFKNAEGVNRPQSELTYKKTMEDIHTHMFPLQAYIMQTRYMCRILMKPHNMSLHTFVAHVNKMNDYLEQFSPRDNGTPQVKLAEDKLMYIPNNAVPKSWQGEMRRQRFDCAAKGQAKFICFCKCLESLDPLKQKNGQDATSATGSNQQIPKKKRGQEANAPNLMENQACKKVAKFCLLHSWGGHTANKCKVLKKQVKGMQDNKEKNTWSELANGSGRFHCCNQNKLNTIIGEIVKAFQKSQHKDHIQHKEHSAINEFNALSLSLLKQ
eukprot:11099339-Ditylum_brightwellii.AAC.1